MPDRYMSLLADILRWNHFALPDELRSMCWMLTFFCWLLFLDYTIKSLRYHDQVN